MRTDYFNDAEQAAAIWNNREDAREEPLEEKPELAFLDPGGKMPTCVPHIIKSNAAGWERSKRKMKHATIKVGDYEETVQLLTNGMKTGRSGFVYIVTDGEAVKIGRAANLASRISSIQVGNPRQLTVLQTIQTRNAMELEATLHHKFKKQHIRGEWFNLLPLFGEVPA